MTNHCEISEYTEKIQEEMKEGNGKGLHSSNNREEKTGEEPSKFGGKMIFIWGIYNQPNYEGCR